MTSAIPALSDESEAFFHLVENQFSQQRPVSFGFNANSDLKRISAVLILFSSNDHGEPILILNKRSQFVRQAGDLCCPGGGVTPLMDRLIAKGLDLPGTPLARWTQGARWRRYRYADYRKLALLLATALREGFEEMRLNPFGLTFWGPMAQQKLVLFKRVIYPMAGWVHHQRRFFPNWEVEKIVNVPFSSLIDANNYARYRPSFNCPHTLSDGDMPCFTYRHHGQTELLWGVTYRIVVEFLEKILDFTPPSINNLPVIHRRLNRHYIDGISKK